MNSPGKPTFAIETIGCKVNQFESQAIREQLTRNGFAEKKDAGRADFLILNSCTVTGKADRETRNLIHRLRRKNPHGKVIVTGCYAESENDRKTLREIPGVVELVRNSEKGKIAEIASNHVPLGRQVEVGSLDRGITDFANRDRAFVKIQDGCDHRCSFCKVRLVRGPSKSRPYPEIADEVTLLAGKGYREIILTGICLGAWGKDFGGKNNLAGLLRKISLIGMPFRARLSSIEPLYVTDELIDTIKENAGICPHLHMPLQSGDDKILKSMMRPYTTGKFMQIVEKIRRHIPGVAITTDILAGFPGEDRSSFARTLNFVKGFGPSRIHVFPYSRREGTVSAGFKNNAERAVTKERVKILNDLGKNLSQEFAKHFIGKTQKALIETRSRENGLLSGYTERYIRVLVNGPDSLKGALASVKIVSVGREKGDIRACLDNGVIV